jgi:hypothetical protein
VSKGKINFQIFPVHPEQFVILNLGSEKKKSPEEGALAGAPSAF